MAFPFYKQPDTMIIKLVCTCFFIAIIFNAKAQQKNISITNNNTIAIQNDSLKVPLFNAVDMNGDSIILNRCLGKVVVINFWNTHCKPCIAEMPSLNKLMNKYKDKEVVFIAITEDGKIQVQKFFQNSHSVFIYHQITDRLDIIKKYVDAPLKAKGNNELKDGSAFQDIRPANIIIDKFGIVCGYSWGGNEDYPMWIDKAIEKALKE